MNPTIIIPGDPLKELYRFCPERSKNDRNYYINTNNKLILIRPYKSIKYKNKGHSHVLEYDDKKCNLYTSKTFQHVFSYGKFFKSIDLVIINYGPEAIELITIKNGWPFCDILIFQYFYNNWN